MARCERAHPLLDPRPAGSAAVSRLRLDDPLPLLDAVGAARLRALGPLAPLAQNAVHLGAGRHLVALLPAAKLARALATSRRVVTLNHPELFSEHRLACEQTNSIVVFEISQI